MKMEQTECFETSAYKIQTPGNYPEENIQRGHELLGGELTGQVLPSNAGMVGRTTGGRFAHVSALRYLVGHLNMNLFVFLRRGIFQNIVLLHRNNGTLLDKSLLFLLEPLNICLSLFVSSHVA